ncbi:hypothetical protein V6N11_060307 [Hibiscus sabdariffa]|uniref:Uncharacterized protein n=1 Tax=Hibiscus sabdariffa TaxID=183260 RepID=A0ABR2QQ93_9ROSI
MTKVQVFNIISDDEIMISIKEDFTENLETKPSIVPNRNFNKPIEVGMRLCVAEDSNGESPASFTAPFVTQLFGTEPTTDSMRFTATAYLCYHCFSASPSVSRRLGELPPLCLCSITALVLRVSYHCRHFWVLETLKQVITMVGN